jgi:hypothetical protein
MTLLSFVRRLAGARPSRAWRRPVALAGLAALAAAAACSEQLEGGAGCTRERSGDLCPLTNAEILDTTLDAVALDTTLTGVPVAGDVGALLLALRPGADSLDVRAVVRFDSVPARFSPPAGGDSVAITSVTATAIRLSLDTTGTRISGPVTVEAYDVDTVASDTVGAALSGLFRPDRLLGRATLATQTVTGDTLSVPLSNAAFAAKAQARARLRVGLRLVATGSARVRFFGVGQAGLSSASPVVTFDPATDTTFRPVQIFPSSVTPGSAELAAAYRTQTVVARTPRFADGADLVVGGLPARRTYLRFAVPARFVDSVDVVRASLLLTQRPSGAADPLDPGVTIRPLAVLATNAVTDLVRASELATGALGLDTLQLDPTGAGVRALPVVNLVRAWRTLPASTPRALVLRSALEGAQAAEVRFYSVEAPAGLRPRLRLSYVPRTNFGLP